MVLGEIGVSMSRPLRDRCARNTDGALRLPRRITWKEHPERNSGLSCSFSTKFSLERSLTARWRSASSCCRGLGVECPGVRLVAAQRATVFPWGALSRRSTPAAPARQRIQLRFATLEHSPAMNNQAAFEMRPVKCPAPVCRVAEKIVSRIVRSAGGCPLYVSGAGALQFEKCLAGSTNRSAAGSLRVPWRLADSLTRSRGSLLSLFACCQAADTRVPVARAKSASADLPAYPISRRGKACRHFPLQSFRENRASPR